MRSTKIQTANVVVALGNVPLPDVVKFANSISKDSSNYLFRIISDNIIKFVHEFNFEDSKDIGSKITLEIVDPEVAFETRLFGNTAQLPFSSQQLKEFANLRKNELDKRRKIKKILEKQEEFLTQNNTYDGFILGDTGKVDEAGSPIFQSEGRLISYGEIVGGGDLTSWGDAPNYSLINANPDSLFGSTAAEVEFLAMGGSPNGQKIRVAAPTAENSPFFKKLKDTGLVLQLDAGLSEDEANEIISKLYQEAKKSGLYKTEETGVLKIKNTANNDFFKTLTEKYYAEGKEIFDTSSLDSLYPSLGLDGLENENPPLPYFYFYYGLGANEANWTGPICAQFTKATYDYSFSNDKKTVTLTFTTTYDFPAFSQLSLEDRGYMTRVDPVYRLLTKLTPSNPTLFFGLNNLARDNTFHHILNKVIVDYIQACTNNIVNVEVLLPDLNKIFNIELPTIINALQSEGGSDLSDSERRKQSSILKAHQYIKVLSDMGFSTGLIFEDSYEQIYANNPFINQVPYATWQDLNRGSIIPNSPLANAVRNFGGYAQEGFLETFTEKKPSTEVGVTVGIGKSINESYAAPLKRIIDGINNKLKGLSMTFELIDDSQLVNKIIEYRRSKNIPVDNLSPDKPLIIFGDDHLIQQYFYGKKYYEDLELFSEQSRTEWSGNLTIEQSLSKYVSTNKNKDTYLTPFDLKKYDAEYRRLVAAPYFLKTNNITNYENFYSYPKDEYQLDETTRVNINKAKIPLFKAGVKESNILDLKLNFNDFFTVALSKLWVQKDGLNVVINSNPSNPVDRKLLNSFDAKLIKNIENQIKTENIDAQGQLKSDVQIDLSKVINMAGQDPKFAPIKDTDEGRDALMNLLIHVSKNISATQKDPTKQKISVSVSNYTGHNAYLAYLNLFSEIVNSTINGYVRTLPIFFLTGTKTSMPPILLITEEPNLPPYNKKSFVSRTFNGFYNIYGFRHTVSSDDVHSEFFIMKDIRLELPEIFNYTKK